MWESFFGFKKTPFSDSPDAKQLFTSTAWRQVNARLELLTQHHGVGLLTGEVGAGKSTAARVFTASLNPNLFKVLYVHFSAGTALDLLRQIALTLDLAPAHFRGDLVRQIAEAVVRLNQSKTQIRRENAVNESSREGRAWRSWPGWWRRGVLSRATRAGEAWADFAAVSVLREAGRA